MTIKLELGKTYSLLKKDESIVTFKFIGGKTPTVIVENESKTLHSILSDNPLAYWEEQI